ncbi:MAG: hypothetical protein AB7T27_02940 [Kiritimatiellia bacterium]
MKMKTLSLKITMLAALLLGGVAFLMTGCDSEDSPDNGSISGSGALDSYFENHPYVSDPRAERDALLQVSPESATVTEVGQRILFRVVGGSGRYTWDVSTPGRGTIQPDPASSDAIYTARAIANNEVIVYDSVGHAGIGLIVTAEDEEGDELAWEADPEDRVLDVNGEMCALQASGGVPPYHWALQNAKGSLNALEGTSVVYTRTQPGDNAVSLTDSASPPTTLWIPMNQP